MQYLATLLDGNTVLGTIEFEVLHQCVFDIFAGHAKALHTLVFRSAIQWTVSSENVVAFGKSNLEQVRFLGASFVVHPNSETAIFLQLAKGRRREADQRGRCLLFCCEQQKPRNAPDLTTTLGAIPLHVLQPAVKDAAECFIAGKPPLKKRRLT